MDEIKVHVVNRGRTFLMMRYIDPFNGKAVEKSSKTSNRREAEKAAGKWEAELREGRYVAPSKITWQAFRERYESEVLTGLKDTTGEKVDSVFNAIETILAAKYLRDVSAEKLSHFMAKLREKGLAESTIAGHRAHLRAALQWAKDTGLIRAVPEMKKPKRAKGGKSASSMKGRPITGEEFDRMLDKVPSSLAAERIDPQTKQARIVEPAPETVEAWRFYLRGLWWSGLRLEESLDLFWDRDDGLRVDLSGRHPMLIIRAESEKGNQDRVLPMAPEFAELLLAVPEGERTGRVFKLPAHRLLAERLTKDRVSRLVGRFGEAAGVKVRTDPAKVKGEAPKVKYASAHDLRRSFGERWAAKVMPQILMVLMRHESIETTMRFYVGRNAQTTAAVLWEAHEKTGGKRPKATGKRRQGAAAPSGDTSGDT